MHTPKTRLANFSRPRLLVRAARLGVPEFNLERSLRRILRGEVVPALGQTFEQPYGREAEMNDLWRGGEAG